MGSKQHLKTAKQRQSVGKSLAPLDKKLQDVEWGEYRLGDLFDFEAIKQARSQKEIPTDDSEAGVPYIVQSTSNNMFSRNVNKRWLVENNEAPVSGNRIVLGVTLPAVSYQPREFGASQVITAKSDWLNERIGNFVAIVISKFLYQFSYARKPGLQIYRDMTIELPTKNGEIDLAFMESFIAELEAERIAELEAYLVASDLKDYTLTKEEMRVLTEFENERIEWGEFEISSLFDINPTKYYRLSNEEILSENGKVPLVSNSSIDNGIMGFSEMDANNKGKTITCSDTTLGAETMYYQKNDFIGYSHIQHFVPKFEKFNWFIAAFIISASRISTAKKYNYGQKFNREAMNSTEIKLFTQNNQPDYTTIETFISAIQKLVIKDVVLYAEQKIVAAKSNRWN